MKFNVKDLVVVKEDCIANTSYTVFRVAAIVDGNLVVELFGSGYSGEIMVDNYRPKPGDRSWCSAYSRYAESELFTPEEALAEIRRLEVIKNDLNGEFEKVLDNIKSKFERAAVLVNEAVALAAPFEKDLFQLKYEGMALYNALEAGGWSHSHMSC